MLVTKTRIWLENSFDLLLHITHCVDWRSRPSHCLANSTCLRPSPAGSFLNSAAYWVVQLNHLKTNLTVGYRCLNHLCFLNYFLFWFEVRDLHCFNWCLFRLEVRELPFLTIEQSSSLISLIYWFLFWLEVRELPFLTIESSSSLISLIYFASKLDFELTSSRRPRSILSFFISFAKKLVFDFDFR